MKATLFITCDSCGWRKEVNMLTMPIYLKVRCPACKAHLLEVKDVLNTCVTVAFVVSYNAVGKLFTKLGVLREVETGKVLDFHHKNGEREVSILPEEVALDLDFHAIEDWLKSEPGLEDPDGSE